VDAAILYQGVVTLLARYGIRFRIKTGGLSKWLPVCLFELHINKPPGWLRHLLPAEVDYPLLLFFINEADR
jgi:hypothetical protein